MKREVVTIHPEANLIEAARLLAHKKVGTLPVVNKSGELVGLTSMRAIGRFFLPDFINVLENVEFVHDFGAIADPSPVDIEKAATITIAEYMQPPFSVEEDASLTRALAIMISQDLQDIPVVRGKKLVGIASRVDVGRAFFDNWLGSGSGSKIK